MILTCEDCKFYKAEDNACKHPHGLSYITPEDFCSKGEFNDHMSLNELWKYVIQNSAKR